MIRNKSERVLLVAPNIFSVQLLACNKQIKHITSVGRVFPSIYEMAPDIIIFDYDYMSDDMEKILRRIRTNPYYNKIKICCFKSGANRKIDGFLKVLGVNHVLYKHELQNPTKASINHVKSIFDSTVTDLLVNASFQDS
jgi:CheY-like chemotaxis protein